MTQNQKSIMSFFSNTSTATPSPFADLKISPKQNDKSTTKSPEVLKERPTAKNSKAKNSGKSKRRSDGSKDETATASVVKKVRISDDVREVEPPSPKKSISSKVKSSPDASPIKSGKRRRVQILESDESGSDIENVVIASPVSEKTVSTPPSTPASIPKRKTAKLSKEFRSKLANRVQTPHTSKLRGVEIKDAVSSSEEMEPSPVRKEARPSPIASKLSNFAYQKREMSLQKNIDEIKAEAEDDEEKMEVTTSTDEKNELSLWDDVKSGESSTKSSSPTKSPSPKKSHNSSVSNDKGKNTLKNVAKNKKTVKDVKSSDSNSESEEKLKKSPSPKKSHNSSVSNGKGKNTLKNVAKNKKTVKDVKSSDSNSEGEEKPKKSPSSKKSTASKKSPNLSVLNSKGKNTLKNATNNKKSVKDVKSLDSNSEGEEKPTIVSKSSTLGSSKSVSSLVSASDVGGYNPKRPDYKPIDSACWKAGEDVPYKALSVTLKAIEETSARLQKTLILSNFLRSVCILTPDDLHLCVYLCSNQVAPAYEGVELGVGETVVMKAIHEACGVNIAAQKAKLKDLADLGLVAEASRSKQKLMFKPKPLSVKSVFKTLLEMTAISGNQGQSLKIGLIKKLLVSCQGSEARFITRSMLGKLRCGLAEQTILVALGHATVQTPPGGDKENAVPSKHVTAKKDQAADTVKTCYCEFPNFEHIIKMIKEHGVLECQEYCKLSPGVPVKPMLAHPTKGISEVLQRFDGCEFSCEFKYDGERAQIQCGKSGEMRIFSRNQENNTSKYPDIISRIGTCLQDGTKSFILDCEVVAWDIEEKKILPFQILTTRKRKDADIDEIKVKVCLFAFDLLYLNGESLVRKPFRERREKLHSGFMEVEGEFIFASAKDCTDTEEIQEFLDESIKNQCEGLMVKTLDKDATYEIAKRSHNWLKVKKDYLEGCGDSLDLAVIGAFQGKGKRSGTYGGYLLACYDPETEQFQAICKMGTGLTDEDLASHHKALSEHIIDSPKSYYSFPEINAPEVWLEPSMVWEVKCADMTISPIYTAAIGLVDPDKGISLRFPRFIRMRDDKSAEDATTAEQVAELYQKQDNKQEQSKPTEEDDY